MVQCSRYPDKNIFLISLKICWVPHCGASNEYPQSVFSRRNEKDVSSLLIKNPYLDL